MNSGNVSKQVLQDRHQRWTRPLFAVIAAVMLSPPHPSNAVPIPGNGPNIHLYHTEDGLICSDCHGKMSTLSATSGSSSDGWGAGNGLKKSNITDLCLSCHTEGNNTPATTALPDVAPGTWVAPIVKTLTGEISPGIAMPAGDFYWSSKDHRRGHNPAYSKGSYSTSQQMEADPILGNRPPGGILTDGEWSCASCHGTHYRFDAGTSAWRQLKRRINNINVTGDVSPYGVETARGNVVQDPASEPIKSNSRGDVQGESWLDSRRDGNSTEGANLFRVESDTNKNVYRGGFSSFCAACHGDFHGGNHESRFSGSNTSTGSGQWIKHPTNIRIDIPSRYGIAAYSAAVSNSQRTNPNPVGYDWKYPLVKSDHDFSVKSREASAFNRSLYGDERIMCLTCHRAHASRYANMTRWDVSAHAFIGNGDKDFTGEISKGDNPAYGCGKCHQMGGVSAYIKNF